MPPCDAAIATLPTSPGPSSVTLSVPISASEARGTPLMRRRSCKVFGGDQEHVDGFAVAGKRQAMRLVASGAAVDEEIAHASGRPATSHDVAVDADQEIAILRLRKVIDHS